MKATRKTIVKLDYRRSSGLFRRDGEYIADIQPDAGGRIIRKLGTDQGRARKLFWDVVDEAENGGENPRFADFLTRSFLPSQTSLKSYAYSEKCVGWLLRFLDAEAPDLRLRDVNRSHVERLRAYYSDLAPQTRNHMTQKLKQALFYAVDVGLLDANPIARVKQLPVDNRRRRVLSMRDVVRILGDARNTDAHDLFLFMALTGLRPSNVRLLTSDEVEDDMIRIPPEKMKNSRWGEVPVSTYATDVLSQRTSTPLFFAARGTADKPKSIDNLSRSYRSVVRRLEGVGWSTLYDLRHFFASQLAKHGATEQQIGRLLCHVGQSVTSRYVHHDIDDLRPFVEEHGERVRVALGGMSTSARAEDETAMRV